MLHTTKRNLNKPESSDNVTVLTDIADNMDNLDDAVPDSRTINGKALITNIQIVTGTPTQISGNNYKLDLRGL